LAVALSRPTGLGKPGLAFQAALLVTFEVGMNLFDHRRVSKVEQMESELRRLSRAELRQIREWLDDFIEDELEFTPEFEQSIRQAERDMADGKSARVREPEGS
jgi:ABC-type iron transport system FetAB ATPase subunit